MGGLGNNDPAILDHFGYSADVSRLLVYLQNNPVKRVCELLGLARSTYYHEPVAQDEQALRAAIEEIAGQFPTYGSRRVRAQLRLPPYGMVANRKRVQRLMREMGLQPPIKRPKPRTTEGQHSHLRYSNLVPGWRSAIRTRSG